MVGVGVADVGKTNFRVPPKARDTAPKPLRPVDEMRCSVVVDIETELGRRVPSERRDMKTGEETLDRAMFDELRLLTTSAGLGFLTGLIDDFVHDAETCLAQLRQAVRGGDRAAVARLAHAIKGMGAQLGGHRLASSCNRLEAKAMSDNPFDTVVDLDELESDYRELRGALTRELSS
jgi:HPt (histidine-containing phosphotransfer) domain-containing protein